MLSYLMENNQTLMKLQIPPTALQINQKTSGETVDLVSDIRAGMQKACKDAGISYGPKVKNGFTFHDLRYTAKTTARKAGVDKNVRMVIFGRNRQN
jgi:hypothetical protein